MQLMPLPREPSRTRDARTSTILCAQGLVVVLLIGLRWFQPLLDVDAESLIYPLCVLLVAQFVWSLWSWTTVSRSLFDFYVLFLVAATMFNGGQAFLEVLHLNESGIMGGEFSPATTAETLFVVILGLAGLHLGALAAAARAPSLAGGNAESDVPAAHDPSLPAKLRSVGWGLLVISLPFSILMLRGAVNVVLSSGYFGLYEQQAHTGLNAGPRVLADFLIPGALFLLAGSKDSRLALRTAVTVIVSYVVIQFFLGTRHYAAPPLIALAWLWHRRVRPLNAYLLAGGALVMLFVVFPLVKATRNTSGGERLSAEYLIASFVSIDNPVIVSVAEMGGSMETVAHTIKLVPASRDYEMGRSYLYALLTVVPNLFWDIHPTVAHGRPSHWLIWTIDPYTATRGGTIGYSFIAEAYLNLGWIGVPVLLGLGGFFYARFILWASQPDAPARLALAACVACFLTFYARAGADEVFRGLVWYSFLPYALVVWPPRVGRARPAPQDIRHYSASCR
jgi:oligosaccharide repeat unit polymerase